MHPDTSFSCIHAATLVCESRDRELTAAELSDIQRHVANCPACQKARQQLGVLFEQLDLYFEKK